LHLYGVFAIADLKGIHITTHQARASISVLLSRRVTLALSPTLIS